MAIFTKPLSTNTRNWVDLDLDFTAHPVTKDIVFKKDVEAVKRSVRNLIRTNQYERPFQPDIDGGVTRYLFELPTPHTKHDLEASIRICLQNHEPRVTVLNVEAHTDMDRNGFNVSIMFRVINTSQPVTIVLFLERLR
jgi:phage baseplate assembly protein W